MALGHALGELAPAPATPDDARAVRHVVVVGGGIAGLACALACARSGARVDVLEARAWHAPVAAHIDLVPNLLRDLARLGVAPTCVQRGFAYSGVAVMDEQGQEAVRIATPHLAGPRLPAAAGITYDALLDVLTRAATEAGASLRAGVAVRRIDAAQGRALADGGRVFAGDLLLLATGAQSPLASAVGGTEPATPRQHAAWHALMPRPTWLERSTLMTGTVGRRLFLVPVSVARAGLAVVAEHAVQGPTDAGALAVLLDGWGALPRRIAAELRPDSPTTFRRVASALRRTPWHRGAGLCVGAAAHAFAPPFGQSAAQALEDAVVLGELLVGAPARAPLLTAFSARREPRAAELHALVEQGARWLARPEPDTDLPTLARRIDALVAQPA